MFGRIRTRNGAASAEPSSAATLGERPTEQIQTMGRATDEALLERRPEAVPRARLQDRLWPKTFVAETSLRRVIAEVRAALGDAERQPHLIRNVRSFGYAFSGAATEEVAARSAEPGTACRQEWGKRRSHCARARTSSAAPTTQLSGSTLPLSRAVTRASSCRQGRRRSRTCRARTELSFGPPDRRPYTSRGRRPDRVGLGADDVSRLSRRGIHGDERGAQLARPAHPITVETVGSRSLERSDQSQQLATFSVQIGRIFSGPTIPTNCRSSAPAERRRPRGEASPRCERIRVNLEVGGRVRQIKIVVEKHPDGYVAYPLGIKGVVVGQGETCEEALNDVRSALAFHVETFGARDPRCGSTLARGLRSGSRRRDLSVSAPRPLRGVLPESRHPYGELRRPS